MIWHYESGPVPISQGFNTSPTVQYARVVPVSRIISTDRWTNRSRAVPISRHYSIGRRFYKNRGDSVLREISPDRTIRRNNPSHSHHFGDEIKGRTSDDIVIIEDDEEYKPRHSYDWELIKENFTCKKAKTTSNRVYNRRKPVKEKKVEVIAIEQEKPEVVCKSPCEELAVECQPCVQYQIVNEPIIVEREFILPPQIMNQPVEVANQVHQPGYQQVSVQSYQAQQPQSVYNAFTVGQPSYAPGQPVYQAAQVTQQTPQLIPQPIQVSQQRVPVYTTTGVQFSSAQLHQPDYRTVQVN